MDFINEKINNVMEKSTLTKPYSILEKIETECCKRNCRSKEFLISLKKIIYERKDKPNSAERVEIFSLFKENFSIFLLIEQIMRKYGGFFCYFKKEEIKKIPYKINNLEKLEKFIY